MQILYCDECGTRVDETEAVSLAGKSYCQQCARKHVPAQKAGGTAVLPPPPRSSRHLRVARTTPARNLATGAGAPISANGVDTRYVASHNAKADTEFEDLSNGADQDAAAPSDSPELQPSLLRNKPVMLIAGCSIVGLIALAIWAMSGSSEAPRTTQTVTKDTATLATRSVTSASGTVIAPSVSTSAATAPVLPKPPSNSNASDPDPRTDKAMRDFKVIKDQIASGKANPFEMRKRLERFIDPFWIRKTPMGLEAIQLLEKFKVEKRPADKADGAVAGVLVGVAAPDTFNTDFNAPETRSAVDINITSAAVLKTAFGRETNIALKFTGFIEVPADGEYTFYLSSDDGSNLYIGDILLVENGGSHPLTERDGTIDLKAGKHRFRLEYYQGTGMAGVTLSWSGPGIPAKQVVPASALSSMPKK